MLFSLESFLPLSAENVIAVVFFFVEHISFKYIPYFFNFDSASYYYYFLPLYDPLGLKLPI